MMRIVSPPTTTDVSDGECFLALDLPALYAVRFPFIFAVGGYDEPEIVASVGLQLVP